MALLMTFAVAADVCETDIMSALQARPRAEEGRYQHGVCTSVQPGQRAPIDGVFTANDGSEVNYGAKRGELAQSAGRFCVDEPTVALLQRAFSVTEVSEFEGLLRTKTTEDSETTGSAEKAVSGKQPATSEALATPEAPGTSEALSSDGPFEGIQVYADIDDTMLCSRAAFLHGMDTNCDVKKEIYPGVAQFLLELGLGASETLIARGTSPPQPIPLSARPVEFKAVLKLKKTTKPYKQFKAVGEKMGLPGWGLDIENALYGSIWTSANWKLVAKTKYRRWVNHNSSLPGIFVGDNGQGDAIAAGYMQRHNGTLQGPTLRAAFIHHVQAWPWGPGMVDLAEKSTLPMPGGMVDAPDLIRFLPFSTPQNQTLLVATSEPGLFRVIGQEANSPGISYRESMNRDDLETNFSGPVLEDIVAGEVTPERPGWLKVHVPPEVYTNDSETGPTRAAGDVQNIYLFREYAHASCIAYNKGFISENGYNRILGSIADECTGVRDVGQSLPWPGAATRACMILKPYFLISGKSWEPLRASSCNIVWTAPTQMPAGTLMPAQLFTQEGRWIIGTCKGLTQNQLRGLTFARDRVLQNERSNATTAHAGLPPSLYWAIKDGVKCLDIGPYKNNCDRSVRNWFRLFGTGWSLQEEKTLNEIKHICALRFA